MIQRLRSVLLPGLLPGLLLLAACGPGAPHEGPPRIAVVPKGTTHEFWKSIHAGALEAAQDGRAEILWKGPQREDDREGQVKVVEDFTIRGVEGIVIAPMDDSALAVPLEEAARRGIPVVVIDSGVHWDGRVSYVATDNKRGGELAGEELVRRLDGEGRVLMMRFMEGSASTREREEGFLAVVAGHEGIEVVSENQYAGATNEGAYSTAENLLSAHAELDGVFCPNESTAFGMLRALQDAGRAGQVTFVGFDASPKLVEALAAGEVHALVVQDPVAMGRQGVDVLLRHLAGEEVPDVVDTGVGVVTAENMQEPAMARLLAPDLSILR